MVGILIVVGVVGVLGLAFTPMGKTVVGIGKNLLIKDAMKDPRLADGAYLTAIEDAKKHYTGAADTYNELTGLLVEANADYTKAETELIKTEEKCERLAKNNDVEGLQLLAGKRNSLIQRKETFYERMLELKPLVEEAKDIVNLKQEEILKLQQDRELKVSELKLTSNMEDLYSKMDKLRNTSATDKLLSQIDTNIKESKRRAVGAKAVHNEKIETKERKLDQKLLVGETDDYIKSLMDKYNN